MAIHKAIIQHHKTGLHRYVKKWKTPMYYISKAMFHESLYCQNGQHSITKKNLIITTAFIKTKAG